MKNLLKNFLITLLFSLFSSASWAMVTVDVYSVERDVATQSDAERARQTRAGFADVLVRVSGNSDVLQNADIVSVLSKADRYLRQFSYHSYLNAEGAQQSSIQLDFDAQSVENLLRNAELPIWSGLRPELVLWLVVEDEQGRHFVSQPDNELLKGLQSQAQLRGMPLVAPLYDLQDEMNLSVTEAWGLFDSSLRQASSRYQGDGLLAGRAYKDSEGVWQSRWRLSFADQQMSFSLSDVSEAQLAQQVMQQAGSVLSSTLAIDTRGASRSSAQLAVKGITDFADYVALTKILSSMTAIRDFELLDVSAQELRFSMNVDGSLDKLLSRLTQNPRLQGPQGASTGAVSTVLQLTWQG